MDPWPPTRAATRQALSPHGDIPSCIPRRPNQDVSGAGLKESEDAVSIIGEDGETVYLVSKANLRDITRTES